MELRHLSFFVAVAEDGSLTLAAEQRLHTAQPSLSRQIRDLEYEVGAQLLVRSASGVDLTPRAGPSSIMPAGARPGGGGRRGGAPGCGAGQGVFRARFPYRPGDGLAAEAMEILKDVLPDIDVTVSSHYSRSLAEALMRGKLDLAFLRPEPGMPDLEYRLSPRSRSSR